MLKRPLFDENINILAARETKLTDGDRIGRARDLELFLSDLYTISYDYIQSIPLSELAIMSHENDRFLLYHFVFFLRYI